MSESLHLYIRKVMFLSFFGRRPHPTWSRVGMNASFVRKNQEKDRNSIFFACILAY